MSKPLIEPKQKLPIHPLLLFKNYPVSILPNLVDYCGPNNFPNLIHRSKRVAHPKLEKM